MSCPLVRSEPIPTGEGLLPRETPTPRTIRDKQYVELFLSPVLS